MKCRRTQEGRIICVKLKKSVGAAHAPAAIHAFKAALFLDELHLAVNGGKAKKEFKITPLTNKEKEVFMALYSLGEVQPFVSYRQIAKKVRSSENLVASYITNLIEKGVPIIKKYDGGIAYIKLDDLFRQVQAKENLVGVNTVLSYWM